MTLKSFVLDGPHPAVTVAAAYSKRRREDTVPLHSVVVERLKDWLRERPPLAKDQPLFELRTRAGWFRNTAKMMKADLEAAGVPYCDEQGLYADFHANRHTFVSNLARADIAPQRVQVLARHSDINLTMNVYTHLEISHQAEAIAALPSPPEMGDLRSEIPMDSTVELALWLALTPGFEAQCVTQHDTGTIGNLESELESARSNSRAERPLSTERRTMAPLGEIQLA